MLTYFVYAPLRMLAFRDFQRLLCARLSLCFKHAPLLVLVFLGFCRLLFGKTPLCKQKSSVQDAQTSTAFLPCFFFVRLWARCSRTFVRSAPCPRLPRLVRLVSCLVNVLQEIRCRLSRFSTLALRPIISLFQTRSAPRPRLSRLLPFALWQITSLQAKKQCSRRTTKARRFAVLFDIKVSIKGAFSGFFSIFGTGYKLLFFGAGEDEYRQRHGKRNEFRSRGCQPKPRHLP